MNPFSWFFLLNELKYPPYKNKYVSNICQLEFVHPVGLLVLKGFYQFQIINNLFQVSDIK